MASPLILQLGGVFSGRQERLEFNEGDVGLAGGIQAAGDGEAKQVKHGEA